MAVPISEMNSSTIELILRRIPTSQGTALNRLLYDGLREAILDGSLKPGVALPASRELAREAGVSRNTVLLAYDQLATEGYVHSRVGSGTFVAQITPDSLLSAKGESASAARPHLSAELSERARALLSNASAAPRQWGAFMPGVPDVTQVPHRFFGRTLAKLWREPAPQLLTYSHGGGHIALREAIAEHLRVARSVICNADQILVTEGVHQAIDLTLRMLVDPLDTVWVEEPGYWGFHKMLQMSQALVETLPVEATMQGAADWPSGARPKVIFVTPSHQYPLGSVLSLARRKDLLELARLGGSWIVEDDYDSEFRFSGRPIAAMQGLVPDAPVIYVGTFSKTLFPSLRVGYMVLPNELAEPFRIAHADLYREGHTMTHMALAEFLSRGHYVSHIRRMRLIYGRRRAALEALIQLHLGLDFLDKQASNAGLHLVLRLPDETDDQAVAALAMEAGILVRPLSRYYIRPNRRRGLLLGYACVQDDDIEPAFLKLLECLRPFITISPRQTYG